MRRAAFAVILVVVPVTVLALARDAAARCSMIISFPSPIGKSTLMMARATPRSVTASVDSQYVLFRRPAITPAQVMRVERIAGYQADTIDAGLRLSGDSAVFVRYGITPGCTPHAEKEDAFDRPGTYGFYRGAPRARADWIDGRPTFDVFMYFYMPYPDRMMRSGYSRGTPSSQIMTSNEMFDLYASVWAESTFAGDSALRSRACGWIRRNRHLASRVHAPEVLDRLLGTEAPDRCGD